jgi:ribosomal protein L40E
MFCIECGTELPDSAKFCFKCGFAQNHKTKTSDKSQETAPQVVILKPLISSESEDNHEVYEDESEKIEEEELENEAGNLDEVPYVLRSLNVFMPSIQELPDLEIDVLVNELSLYDSLSTDREVIAILKDADYVIGLERDSESEWVFVQSVEDEDVQGWADIDDLDVYPEDLSDLPVK